MIGGGFMDNLKSVFKWISNPQTRKDIGSVVRTGLDIHDVYKGNTDGHQKTRKVIGYLGGARSGGSLGGGLLSRLK